MDRTVLVCFVAFVFGYMRPEFGWLCLLLWVIGFLCCLLTDVIRAVFSKEAKAREAEHRRMADEIRNP